MGGIIKPICSCNTPFNDLYLGGGKMNFTKVCTVPSVCMNCGTISINNILNDHHICGQCKSEKILIGKMITDNELNELKPPPQFI